MSAEAEDGGGRELGAVGAASAGVGAAVAAGVASACCVGPVAAPMMVAVLGAGGAAWAASLKPFSPYILAASGLLLAYAFLEAYRPRVAACETDEGSCALDDGGPEDDEGAPAPGSGERSLPSRRRWLRGVIWSATVLWVLSVGLNLFLPSP